MNIWVGIAVNFGLPLLGVIVFILLCRRMKQLRIPAPPILAYFILFASFGGWLMVFTTGLFWVWSGMASLGVVFLVLIAPLLTAAIALASSKRRNLSAFHRGAFIASIAYSVLAWTALGCFTFLR